MLNGVNCKKLFSENRLIIIFLLYIISVSYFLELI